MTAPFNAIVVTGIPEVRRKLVPARWWAALLHIAPRALTPTAAKLKSRAPVGETGKLSRGFDVRAKAIHQGFIQGVQAEIGARVGYGHLVARGHKIIARGPTTKGKLLTRVQRSTNRAGLKARRQGMAIGFVPGNPFAEQAFLEDRAQIIRLIEKMLEQEVTRAA